MRRKACRQSGASSARPARSRCWAAGSSSSPMASTTAALMSSGRASRPGCWRWLICPPSPKGARGSQRADAVSACGTIAPPFRQRAGRSVAVAYCGQPFRQVLGDRPAPCQPMADGVGTHAKAPSQLMCRPADCAQAFPEFVACHPAYGALLAWRCHATVCLPADNAGPLIGDHT